MKITVIIYIIIAIAVIVFVVKDSLSVIEGDHTGYGSKPRGRMGMRGFLMLTFFIFFTCLWTAIFWQ
jgi:hypothetical protein